jgi:hypothetical protein
MSREVKDSRGPGSGVRDPIPGDREARVLQEIEDELRTALSISPSEDFEARVLRRVAEDEAPARWSYGWLAAAALILLATGLFFALNRTPAPGDDGVAPQMAERQPDVRLPAPAQQEPPLAPEGPAYESSSAPARKGPAYASASVGRGSTPRRASEPEVIVPLNQMEAVRRLVRAVNEGRMEAPPEPATGPIAAPVELGVAPIVIEPLPVPPLEPEGAGPSPEIRRSR